MRYVFYISYPNLTNIRTQTENIKQSNNTNTIKNINKELKQMLNKNSTQTENITLNKNTNQEHNET